ncbi:U8 snoRNA-decapping enzyme-like isoform X1 [Nilaparvata lugens]|uniref:U8 snoRNA-decapping enzyme-like isoform X1 n=1 Tax=Nilaparvata lugens TaxID=108931 RepID=UPI00193C9553|nr:U8 snoRNA-decapping enzyme-like isoform X1 [Nilaparvata lugens]
MLFNRVYYPLSLQILLTEIKNKTFSKCSKMSCESLNTILRSEYKGSTEGCHCLIYAKSNEKIFGVYEPRAAVLMQMRFDGYLGFPGGLVDPGEDVIHGLNRELEEEMNLDLSKHKVTEKDFVFSQHSSSRELTLHFYALETTLPELEKIEAGVHQAKDYGSEVLGLVRVPLYTMRDGFRGFPAFLTHAFIGSAREQLLHTLQHLKIMTPQEISNALSAKPNKS